MNLEKLKLSARRYEQREEWRKAIDTYLKVIEGYESGAYPGQDLAVYNRIGDLYMRINATASAVQSYERAVELYSDQGMANQAIALCSKILRVNPGRVQAYLKLANLHAEKTVVSDAKKNLIEYLERMNALGNREDALIELKAFAKRFAGNRDIRVMLSALLRAMSRDEEAREELEQLADDLESRGDADGARRTREHLETIDPGAGSSSGSNSGLIFLDVGAELEGLGGSVASGSKTPEAAPLVGASEPELLDLSEDLEIDRGRYEEEDEEAVEVEPVGELEHTSVEDDERKVVPTLEGLLVDGAGELGKGGDAPAESLGLTIEHTTDDEEIQVLEASEPAEDDEADAEALTATPTTGLVADYSLDVDEDVPEDPVDGAPADEGEDLDASVDELEVEVAEEVTDLEIEEPVPVGAAQGAEPRESAAVSFLREEPAAGPSIVDLEDRILDDPDDPQAHRMLGEALIAAGDADRGIEELELALRQYESAEDWGRASGLVTEMIRLDPNRIAFYQKRVELAFRSADKARLIEAYLALGDVLVRVGSLQKAAAVYGRVLEHDPENTLADAALQSLETDAAAEEATSTDAAPAPGGESFVDLGEMVLEEARPKDARIRIQRTQPTGDESQDFAEILEHFKQGIEETIEVEDFQSHYDLGVAFKEMGLLDEAIAEFQKALRAPEGRLRTSEALGVSFFEKDQFPIAEAILKRAVDSLAGPDGEKIGLLYWLGRSREEQGKRPEALLSYQRAMTVDVGFRDVSERIAQLTGGGGGE
jgi:tetratricopeptide (TPR) repeat protein